MADPSSSSYIDYTALTSPAFTPQTHANALITQTNNPTDTPLDLSTPLSRVLFDVQEIDTHIDSLTTSNALPIINDTQSRSDAGRRVLEGVEEQVKQLNEGFERLQREVGERYQAAEEVRLAAERMVRTLRLGRGVQRCLTLGRQLEGLVEEVGREGVRVSAQGARGLVPAAGVLLQFRELFAGGQEGEGLGRVNVVSTLRQELVGPAERNVLGKAQQVVREFSMSGLVAAGGGAGASGQGQGQGQGQQTFAQTEETKGKAVAALQTLYLLSPTKTLTTAETFEPTLLIQALQSYLQTALTSSVAALARALATLPTLDKTLLEISARCQNIVALESLLASTKAPAHPLLLQQPPQHPNIINPKEENFLSPLLRHLDTFSLPSYFWRSMAGQLSPRVQEILSRGGVSARTLRTNRDRVREGIRECVDRGTRMPGRSREEGAGAKGWEREAAVMVGSVVGVLGR